MRATAMTLTGLAVVGFALSACGFGLGTSGDDGGGEAAATGSTESTESSVVESSASSSVVESTGETPGDADTTSSSEPSEPADPAEIDVITETAERFISMTIAEQFGAPLEPSCPDVPSTAAGTTFSCTAATPDGEIVELDATIDEGDNLNVVTTNVVLARFLPDLERVGAQVLADAGAVALTIDCGTESLVLDERQEIVCPATETDGTVASVTYLIEDTRTGDFEIRVN